MRGLDWPPRRSPCRAPREPPSHSGPPRRRPSLALALFSALLLGSALLGLPMLYPVLAGLLGFALLGLGRGIPLPRLARAAGRGFGKSLTVVLVILLIGLMGAAWRSSGLMALLLVKGLSLVHPPLFLLSAFILSSAFSLVLGSSLGAASVMGVVLSALGEAAGVEPLFTTGAILSGIYVGDRASFLSSSALLVASLARIEHRVHLRNMRRSSLLPFLLSALLYALLSRLSPYDPGRAREALDFRGLFELGHPALWLPLALVLLPAFTKLRLRGAILLSAAAALALAILLQGEDPGVAARDLLFGYARPEGDPRLSLLSGGGLLSLAKPMLIVFFSGGLPPLLAETGVLAPLQDWLARLAAKSRPFAAALASGALTSALGCSQTLATFLQFPLLDKVYAESEAERKALAVGSTSILLSALVPWNIAMAAPLAILGASRGSGLFAFYLYLLPLLGLVAEFRRPRAIYAGSATKL